MTLGDVFDRVEVLPLLVMCGATFLLSVVAGAWLIWTDPNRRRK